MLVGGLRRRRALAPCGSQVGAKRCRADGAPGAARPFRSDPFSALNCADARAIATRWCLPPDAQSEGRRWRSACRHARVLTALFLPVEHQVNLSELAEQTGVSYGSVHREVERLVDAGILTEERWGKARYVRPNQSSVLWRPLRDLVTAAFGPVPLLRTAFEGVPGVAAMALFGSYAARLAGNPGPP